MVALDTTLTLEIERVFHLQQANQYAVARTNARERIAKLRRLERTMLEMAPEIYEALWADLRKGRTETDISEIGVVNCEIRHVARHLKRWMATEEVATPLTLLGSRSEIRYEPKGVSLIISPWNYPLQLALAPLVTAVAAGNCVIIKPTEFAPHSIEVLKKIVSRCFPEEEVAVFDGGVPVAQALLELPFNHVYFTGSPAVGKIVMAAAAKHLASVTLELGGKSPVVVDETANLDAAADKIAWVKAMNAGQICIAPDYLLVHESVQATLLEKIETRFKRFYGETEAQRRQTPDLCRLVHEQHFDRTIGLLEDALQRGAKLVFGGKHDRSDRYLEPTVLTNVPDDAPLMETEIFGPILPVRSFKTLEEAIEMINSKPKSLAMYVFSRSKRNIDTLISGTRNGGVAVNDCAAHYYNSDLPFGGANNSGIGKGHGKFAFLEFTNARSVLHQNRYFPTTDYFLPPYGGKLAKLMLEGVKRFF